MKPLVKPRFDATGENFWIDDIFFKCLVGGDYHRIKTDKEGVVLLKIGDLSKTSCICWKT